MAGVGRPTTPKAIWLSYTTLTSSVDFGAINPGKRTSGFDFSYRVPYLRDWLTIYSDSLATDNTSPWADPPRAAWSPGIYLTRFPKLTKLDLRIEASIRILPKFGHFPGLLAANGQFNYWDSFYHDLYTNEGNLIGSWVGREGHGYQAWTTYHVSARNWIQLGYRHADVATDFVPRGGNINDASVKRQLVAPQQYQRDGVSSVRKVEFSFACFNAADKLDVLGTSSVLSAVVEKIAAGWRTN